jgi:hypothetical protein
VAFALGLAASVTLARPVAAEAPIARPSYSQPSPTQAPRPAREEAAQLQRVASSLREQLQSLGKEIDVLKRGPRSVTSDYRLRDRMATAQTIGLRLTDTEARLRALGHGPPAEPTSPAPSVKVLPTDGPQELSAKADILVDQALRLSRQATQLEERAGRFQRRDSLRRRMGRLERDPFVGLESSNRSLTFSVRRQNEERVIDDKSNLAPTLQPPTGDSTPPQNTSEPQAAGVAGDRMAESSSNPPPQTGNTDGSPPQVRPPSFTEPGADSAGVSIEATFRALLDPATLAEVRRLELHGTSASRAEALQKAAAALRARAQRLQEDAKKVRAGAR